MAWQEPKNKYAHKISNAEGTASIRLASRKKPGHSRKTQLKKLLPCNDHCAALKKTPYIFKPYVSGEVTA
jgi:hypothetical protein